MRTRSTSRSALVVLGIERRVFRELLRRLAVRHTSTGRHVIANVADALAAHDLAAVNPAGAACSDRVTERCGCRSRTALPKEHPVTASLFASCPAQLLPPNVTLDDTLRVLAESVRMLAEVDLHEEAHVVDSILSQVLVRRKRLQDSEAR